MTSGPNFATTLTGATATTNVKLAAGEALGGAVTANALLLPNGGLTVSGAGSLNLNSGLLVSTGAGNTVSVNGLTLGTTEGLLYVDSGDLTVSGNISGTGATVLAGQGRPGHAGPGGQQRPHRHDPRHQRRGARRQQQRLRGDRQRRERHLRRHAGAGGVNIPAPETLNVAGFGEGSLAAVGLRIAGGNSTWQGNVTLGHNRTAIDVPAGLKLIDRDLHHVRHRRRQQLQQARDGTLQLAGNASNTLANNQDSYLWQGTVELNKNTGLPGHQQHGQHLADRRLRGRAERRPTGPVAE